MMMTGKLRQKMIVQTSVLITGSDDVDIDDDMTKWLNDVFYWLALKYRYRRYSGIRDDNRANSDLFCDDTSDDVRCWRQTTGNWNWPVMTVDDDDCCRRQWRNWWLITGQTDDDDRRADDTNDGIGGVLFNVKLMTIMSWWYDDDDDGSGKQAGRGWWWRYWKKKRWQ